MRVFRYGFLLVLLAAVFSCGCEKRPMYDYSDEPFVYRFQGLADTDLKQMLVSVYADDRQIGLRIISRKAARALADGREGEAEDLVGLLMAHFERERSPEVRDFLVGVALRDSGVKTGAVRDFLLKTLASGESAGAVCQALAWLYPDSSFEPLLALVRHPRADLRYLSLLALSTLPDARVPEALASAAQEMSSPQWPATVCGMPLEFCRRNLLARSEALSGARPWARSDRQVQPEKVSPEKVSRPAADIADNLP